MKRSKRSRSAAPAVKAVTAPVRQSQELPRPSHDAGSMRGQWADWNPIRIHVKGSLQNERGRLNARVDDLYANNGTAKSAVNSLTTNIVAAGLTPQSILPWKRLGIDREQARELQDQIEWLWDEWCQQAHYRGQYGFATLQSVAVRSLIRSGEFVHLPIMEKRPRAGTRFRLRIQDVSPARLRTPEDRAEDPYLHDGVEVNETGVPVAYWIASPQPQYGYVPIYTLTSDQFVRLPASLPLGRRGVFHVFAPEEEEQYRGVSALSPVVNFLRSFTDSIDNELLAQVLASSFPVFIGLENGPADLPGYVQQSNNRPEPRYYQDIQGGQIMYGNQGEKPEVLESSRPSANFLSFCDLILHQIGAAVGIPYEVLTKDFSKTNYSSARAALLEAWRVYDTYRAFFVCQYCQPIFGMVLEEAFLGGLIDLPVTVGDFYARRNLWANARWTGPARGYVDPQKEIVANIKALEAGLASRSDIVAERGGDFEEISQRLAEEKELRQELGIESAVVPPRDDEPQNQDENAPSLSDDETEHGQNQ